MTALEFISLEDAAAMKTGTRITFIPGLQALYAEALKNLCYVKRIPIIRALHPMMGIDKATGQNRPYREGHWRQSTGNRRRARRDRVHRQGC